MKPLCDHRTVLRYPIAHNGKANTPGCPTQGERNGIRNPMKIGANAGDFALKITMHSMGRGIVGQKTEMSFQMFTEGA
jgi:hypothetical protein